MAHGSFYIPEKIAEDDHVFSLEEVKTLYGLATVFPETLANPWLLGATMLFWIVAPLALAYTRFRH